MAMERVIKLVPCILLDPVHEINYHENSIDLKYAWKKNTCLKFVWVLNISTVGTKEKIPILDNRIMSITGLPLCNQGPF